MTNHDHEQNEEAAHEHRKSSEQEFARLDDFLKELVGNPRLNEEQQAVINRIQAQSLAICNRLKAEPDAQSIHGYVSAQNLHKAFHLFDIAIADNVADVKEFDRVFEGKPHKVFKITIEEVSE